MPGTKTGWMVKSFFKQKVSAWKFFYFVKPDEVTPSLRPKSWMEEGYQERRLFQVED